MNLEIYWFLHLYKGDFLKIEKELSPWGVRFLRIVKGEYQGVRLLQVIDKPDFDSSLKGGWWIEIIGHVERETEETDLVILRKPGNPAVLYYKNFDHVGWRLELGNSFDASIEQCSEMLAAREFFNPQYYMFENEHRRKTGPDKELKFSNFAR